MESLSSLHADESYWFINQELNTSFSLSQLRINTSDYDISPDGYDDGMKHSKKQEKELVKIFYGYL